MITLNALDKGKEVVTSFMDPSKVFDTLKHNFITCQSKCLWPFFQCNKIG